MTRTSQIKAKMAFAGLAVALALVVSATPARAADPIYPMGSLIGLVPPTGMLPSKTFPGFEDPDNHAAMILTALPVAAYSEIDQATAPDLLKKQGIILEKREPMELSFGKGFLIVGTQAADNVSYRKWLLIASAGKFTVLVSVQVTEPDTAYPDDAVRAALATLSVRASVPDAERLSLLPFTVGDFAGFHIQNVLPGRALVLTDNPDDNLAARLLVAAEPGGPDELSDHGNFARMAFDTIGGIKDVQIIMSEPLRLAGQPGYQTMAQAKDPGTDTNLMVVQWLRFGGGGFVQMVGIARTDGWTDVLTRLRAVRDSIALR